MKRANNIFLDILPSVDLHGYDRESAIVKTKDFILENIVLGNNQLLIVHGIGENILKNSIHQYLAKEKRVLNYKLDNYNQGCTIVTLKIV